MMGYAESTADLARGAELHELRTGDLGRQHDDGLWEVTGRLGRHAKVLGLRLDLDRLESLIGNDACVVVVDGVAHAFVDRPPGRNDVARRLSAAAALPVGAVSVHCLELLPRTASGKPDYAALAQQARAAEQVSGSAAAPVRATPQSLRDLYAVVLGRPGATVHDSFVALGGDSLSFVEISTRLSEELGVLPRPGSTSPPSSWPERRGLGVASPAWSRCPLCSGRWPSCSSWSRTPTSPWCPAVPTSCSSSSDSTSAGSPWPSLIRAGAWATCSRPQPRSPSQLGCGSERARCSRATTAHDCLVPQQCRR